MYDEGSDHFQLALLKKGYNKSQRLKPRERRRFYPTNILKVFILT
jgi:hypothetical protein